MILDNWLAEQVKRAYLQRIEQMPDQNNNLNNKQSAIIFAPHQDDETLGCGGTILLKRMAGAEIKIVFMTDGRTSHSQFIPVDQLIEIREQEALAAGAKLGVDRQQITFLRYPDGELGNFYEPAVQRVCHILKKHQPAQVFIPYRREFPPDHLSTNQIVLSALASLNMNTEVFEYPIWFWFHWPWVSAYQPSRYWTKHVIKNSLQAGFGLKLIQDFQYAIMIESVIREKRSALEQYKSQMTRLIPNPAWPTLSDVAAGKFLSCFFQKKEMFLHYPFQRR